MSSQNRRAKGSGSVHFDNRSGKWIARITIPAGLDHPSRRREKSATSRREAERLLAEMRRDLQRAPDEVLPRPRCTLGWFISEQWPRHLAEGKTRPRTREEYQAVARRYLVPVLGHRRMADIRARDVDALVVRLAERGLAPATQRRAAQVAVILLRAGERDRIVPTGVADSITLPSGAPTEDPPRLTLRQADAVVAQIAADYADSPRAVHVAALAVAQLGVRRGEACGLDLRDYDATERLIEVRRSVTELATGDLVVGPPKSKRGRRTLPCPPELARMLAQERLRRGADEWAPQRPTNLSRYLREAVKAAGVDSRGGAHEFRRVMVDRLIAAGVPVAIIARFMGHSEAVMLNVYAGPLQNLVVEVRDVLERHAQAS